jgi:predicted membrane-bound mannosyltransferase/DNA-binding beta-propeller fold protein YncE
MIENKPASSRFWNIETVLIVILIVLAIVSRLVDLGARTMSHDEINHVVPAYDYFQGRTYNYDPVTHGPFQFHMMALSFFLFGDSDFTARLPHALFGIFSIAFTLIFFRRYLGRVGAIAAGIFLLISPYMLFYGRYARNEIFIVVWGLLTIYTILRYLEAGESAYLYLFTAVNALHFTDKATSYIFAALELFFLAVFLIYRVTRSRWVNESQFRNFLIGLMVAILTFGSAAVIYVTQKPLPQPLLITVAILGVFGLAGMVFSIVGIIKGFGITGLRAERSFDLLILLITLVLPLGAALPVKLTGGNPLTYDNPSIIRDAIIIGLLAILAVGIGWWWKREKWFIHAAIFYIPFFLLYSSFFNNGVGVAGGFMGALGYWMEQQGVQRGSQPWYFYALLQIPVYEFLPAFGALIAVVIGLVKQLWIAESGHPFTRAQSFEGEKQAVPTLSLLIYWSVMTLIAFSYAGEKMPWLTIHIALPLCLAAGWTIGWVVESIHWPNWREWTTSNYARIALLAFFSLLTVLTVRTSYRAAFINYDNATEYLVYAHAAGDPKTFLKQIEDLSERSAVGNNIVVAYDNNVRYPYWWYMRRYPNRIDFDKNPTPDIRRALVIIVSPENEAKVKPIIRENYYPVPLMRLWWPNMDYWNLKWENINGEYVAQSGQDAPPMTYSEYSKRVWEHVKPFFTNAEVRKAIWEIWYNRDFTDYAKLKNSDSFTLTTWSPAEKMTAYIRKDAAAQVWNYGSVPSLPVVQTEDPYESAIIQLQPDGVIGTVGSEPGQFQAPRMIALGNDGSLYVADSRNHRIQHLGTDGSVLQTWGGFADASQGSAPEGMFNEPWGVAVSPDGTVYVSDTWNHRIQKFTADGKFLSTWGVSGLADSPFSFYGPRGIAVGKNGQIYVADTGNNRIVVFDENGAYITQFGSPGINPGEFSEPVGVAVDADGLVYVTDTWNQRIQVFAPDASGKVFQSILQIPVTGWYSQTVENKPFIALDALRNIYVSDPESCRVLEFSPDGQIVRVWGQCSSGSDGFGLPVGLALDPNGIWVSDSGNNSILHFTFGQ